MAKAIWLGALFLFAAAPTIREASPQTILWAAPSILIAAMVIAWAAESAQFFIAQGFALAILAWMQTLPEFAMEAVFAWRQQVPYLFASLTGALRLLTGLGWPMIYCAAAVMYRRRERKPLGKIVLEGEHSVQVIGLLVPLIYISFVAWKGSLHLADAVVLTAIYAAYLALLGKMPPQDEEGIEDLERIPRAICFCAVGRALYLRISGRVVHVLLGADGPPRAHGANEPGFEQHQSVDAAGSDAAGGVVVEPGARRRHSTRRPTGSRGLDDHRTATGGDAFPGQHGAGLVGGSGTVRAVVRTVRLLRYPSGRAIAGSGRSTLALVGDHRLFRVGGMGVAAAVARETETAGLHRIREDVAGARPPGKIGPEVQENQHRHECLCSAGHGLARGVSTFGRSWAGPCLAKNRHSCLCNASLRLAPDRVGGASQPRPPTPPYVLAVYGGFINVVTDHIW
jgi:Ca2+/Na+ antiporter